MKFNIKTICLFLVGSLLFSCDPEENRMVFFNNSNVNLNVELLNFKDSLNDRILPSRIVNSNSKERFVKLSSWESVFDNIQPDSLIQVVIYKDILKNHEDNKLRNDSLLSIGKYEYRSYSYMELEKRDWEINYPDDGFKKGFPIKHFNEQSDKNLLPSPHILKEKGIKDR